MPEEGTAGVLVVPRPVARARFHGEEDMDTVVPALLEDVPDALLLPEGLDLPDELDLESVLPGDAPGVLPDFFPEAVGKGGVVEYPDVLA